MSVIRVASLPVPIGIDLPDGWEIDQGDDLADGVAAVARHPRADQGVRATVTVAQEPWPDGASLVDLADTTVIRVARSVGQVGIRNRADGGTSSRPWLVQLLDIRSWGVTGRTRDLVQVEANMGVVADDRAPSVLVRITLSGTTQQSEQHRETFERTVSSLVAHPDTGGRP